METLQHYAGDPNFDRFLAGQISQETDSKRHWVDLVQRRVGQGVCTQRVHVVTEPWSDYLRFELTWSYPPNAAAGEEVRILTVPAAWDGPDFWMFDEREVWLMHYDSDGTLGRVENASASGPTLRACLARKEQALAASTPLLAEDPTR